MGAALLRFMAQGYWRTDAPEDRVTTLCFIAFIAPRKDAPLCRAVVTRNGQKARALYLEPASAPAWAERTAREMLEPENKARQRTALKEQRRKQREAPPLRREKTTAGEAPGRLDREIEGR